MRKRLADYQETTGELFNLEATPAESTSYRLAKHDVKNFPGLLLQVMTNLFTQTLRNCQLTIPKMCLMPLIIKKPYKPSIPGALFFTPLWVRQLKTGRLVETSYVRLRETTRCPTLPFLQPTLFAVVMAT